MGSPKQNEMYPPKKPALSTTQNERFDRYMKLAAVALQQSKATQQKRD
ncbi:MAG: hypothetical protein JWO13_3242 [Acidobacteriales bacterium]|nr:hypothetical protein [Terriglobales bacterium]